MKFLFSFCLSLLPLWGISQSWEFGGGLGPSNYLGEIGGVYEPKGFISDLQLKKTRMGLSAFGRYNFTDKFALSAGLAHGWIEGADSLSLQPSRFSRNLSCMLERRWTFLHSKLEKEVGVSD